MFPFYGSFIKVAVFRIERFWETTKSAAGGGLKAL